MFMYIQVGQFDWCNFGFFLNEKEQLVALSLVRVCTTKQIAPKQARPLIMQ